MLSFLKEKAGQPSAPYTLKAFAYGKVIPMEEVKDPVFSGKMLGDGLAIEPTDEYIFAPCDGIISTVMEDSRHAVGITAPNGMELLIHEGIDTVSLQGEGFTLYVKEGDCVKTGDKLIHFDASLIRSKGYPVTCILVVTNSDNFPDMRLFTGMEAVAGETVVAKC